MKLMGVASLVAIAMIRAGNPAMAQKSKDTLSYLVPDPDASIDTY